MSVIKLHDLKPAAGSKTAKTRLGRGEGSKGKTAGRGTKGTKARKNVAVTFEGGQMPIHMRLPKLKGFRNRFRTEYGVVNVGDIAKAFPQGGPVGLEDLVAKGLVRKNVLVKVLGDGAPRIANTTMVAVPGVRAETAVIAFDVFGNRSAAAWPRRSLARCISFLLPRVRRDASRPAMSSPASISGAGLVGRPRSGAATSPGRAPSAAAFMIAAPVRVSPVKVMALTPWLVVRNSPAEFGPKPCTTL